MSTDHFIYPVVIEQAPDGVGLYFPDFPGTAILAPNPVHGIKSAKEMLIDRLLELTDKKEAYPIPTPPEKIELFESTDRIVFLEVYLPPFRDELANKAVTKNCTLPKWLRDAGEAAGLNFSLLLQSSVKQALGIKQFEQRP